MKTSYWRKGEELIDEFAVMFGYCNMDEVYAASDPIYEDGGLVTWFITRCADGALQPGMTQKLRQIGFSFMRPGKKQKSRWSMRGMSPMR